MSDRKETLSLEEYYAEMLAQTTRTANAVNTIKGIIITVFIFWLIAQLISCIV